MYRQCLDYELTVCRESLLTKLGKALLDLQDMEIGDEGFDEEMNEPRSREESEPTAAKLLLGRPE